MKASFQELKIVVGGSAQLSTQTAFTKITHDKENRYCRKNKPGREDTVELELES